MLGDRAPRSTPVCRRQLLIPPTLAWAATSTLLGPHLQSLLVPLGRRVGLLCGVQSSCTSEFSGLYSLWMASLLVMAQRCLGSMTCHTQSALLLHTLLFLVFLGPLIPETTRDPGSYLV